MYILLFLTVLQYNFIGSALSAECHQHMHLRNLLTSKIKRVIFFCVFICTVDIAITKENLETNKKWSSDGLEKNQLKSV